MRRPAVWGMLVLLLGTLVRAEEPATRADPPGQTDTAPATATATADGQEDAPGKPTAKQAEPARASQQQAAPDATRKAKPRKQDSKKKSTAAKAPAKATPLRLQLPETGGLSPEVDPAAALATDVDLPDLFSDKGADGRVVVDGRFLLEEDLETHPGSRTDSRLTEDAVRKQRGDGVEDYLQGVEGAELRLRIRME